MQLAAGAVAVGCAGPVGPTTGRMRSRRCGQKHSERYMLRGIHASRATRVAPPDLEEKASFVEYVIFQQFDSKGGCGRPFFLWLKVVG